MPFDNDPGSLFRSEPRQPTWEDRQGVENDAKLALLLGLVGIFCIPLGWAAAYFGVRAIGRAKDLGMPNPGRAIAGIVLGVVATLWLGGSTLVGLMLRTAAPTPPPIAAPSVVPTPQPPDVQPPPKANDGAVVQPGAGRGPHLELRITRVYAQHKPSAKAPFHEAGGAWTFFDLEGDDGVALTAGVYAKHSEEAFAFGDAQLSVGSPAAGAAFTKAFDAQFGGTATGVKAGKPRPLKMGAAILGTDMVRSRHGGFRSGRFGNWTATKLFPEVGGRQGEVFFNYSVEDQLAELTEKDADYADDLAFVFHSAFAGK